ncbi:MAG: hypothetical protein KAW41_03100 [Candidatus Diapherotrites archaeon]|nr:hypothetical protein [Candidatus Diapherotrites archaeon]
MRGALLFALLMLTALALPQWSGEFSIVDSSATAKVTVSGESPLAIDIPSGASITGANYSNGTAVFNKSFSYSYSADSLLADSNGDKLFLFVLDQPTEFNYTVTAFLPPGVSIESPAPDSSYVTDGSRIGARWAGTAGQAQFSLRYRGARGARGPVVQFIETDIPIVDKTIFLPGIILAFLFGYFLAAGTVAALFQRIRLITAGMNEDEKSIVYLLRDGPLEQSAIQKKLDFSKAKLSRTLRGMEERNILKKTPKGKTNVISLN